MMRAARYAFTAWGGGHFALVYIAMLLGVTMVTAMGQARATEPMPPFTVAFEDGWSATTLNGVSSDPRDQASGLRQRAQWQGADGSAAMEFTCMWKTSEPDLERELRQITDGVAAGMQAKGLAFVQEAPHRVRTGGREWRLADARIEAEGEIVGRQRFSVASGERCFLSATFVGTPLAYEQQLPVFKRVLASLREAPAQ